jgi:hypothetical protein
VRLIFVVFVVLLAGMVIGGGAHLAASIVSHIFGVVFHYPLFSVIAIAGIAIGLWIGRDQAVYRIGEYEKQEIRQAIEQGGKSHS